MNRLIITIIFLFLPFITYSQNSYISNKDYNEFVSYVKDSLIRYELGEYVDEEYWLICNTCDESEQFKGVNWDKKINKKDRDIRDVLDDFFVDRYTFLGGTPIFAVKKYTYNGINIYPDVLIWFKDSLINKSWATFLSNYYFSHSYFEKHPVYGLNEEQIKAYLNWKKLDVNEFQIDTSLKSEINLTLPKEKLKVTIGEYFQFYKYTRDSTIRMMLGNNLDELKYFYITDEYGVELNVPIINWKTKIKWNDEQVMKTLKKTGIINEDNKIDNRRFMYKRSFLNLYAVINLPDSIDIYDLWGCFNMTYINLGSNKYIEELMSLDISKQLKDKTEIDYLSLVRGQLEAFYYWKKYNYTGKDVFEGFVPYGSLKFYEEDPELFFKDNDVELFRTGKLSNDFYKFNFEIPIIRLIKSY